MIKVAIVALVIYLIQRLYKRSQTTFVPMVEPEEDVAWEVIVNINPSNELTWPQGDRIWDIARAIARAEGYHIPGSVPARLCNPGDISDGANLYGYEEHSGSKITRFPDHETGWHWAANWSAWVSNVTKSLGVSPQSSLADYVRG